MHIGPRVWRAASWMVVAALIVTVARYYNPNHGFTRFIAFSQNSHRLEIAPVREAPHEDAHSGYDGQFYAQLAVDPLIRDPAIDSALDLAPYRARRILMSWIAFAAGFGRPAWILQAYSLINVAAWLLLAWLLARVIPPTTGRDFALWTCCLTSHGMLSSIRYAVPDGLSVLLIAAAIVVLDRNHPWMAALVLGVAGLARETNLLASASFGRLYRRNLRSLIVIGACVLLAVLPLLLWLDYLRSIYRSMMVVHDGQITTPLWGVAWKLKSIWGDAGGLAAPQMIASVFAVIAWGARTAWTGRLLMTPDRWAPWTLVALAYSVMSLTMHPVVWEGSPGAFTRVLLPLAVATNVTMAMRRDVPWAMIVAANLDVVPGIWLLVTGV